MDFKAGALESGRWLFGSELRSPEVFRKPASNWGFFPKRGEPFDCGVFQEPIRAGETHGVLRFKLPTIGSAHSFGASALAGSHHSSTHAHVSHGALRFLRFPLQRH